MAEPSKLSHLACHPLSHPIFKENKKVDQPLPTCRAIIHTDILIFHTGI